VDRERTEVKAHRGFFPFVWGDTVKVMQSGGRFFLARGDLSLVQGGGEVIAAGGGATITQGGAQLLVAAGDVTIDRGGALVAVAPRVEVRNSYLGMAVGTSVEVTDSKIMLGTQQAAAFGAAAGVVAGLVLALIGAIRRRGA
jgi:hypothetical protein